MDILQSIAKTVLTPLTVVYRIPDLIRSGRSMSLLDYTKVTRVEPIALIDHTISHVPAVEDVCRTMTATFAAYYLQGVALSVNVGNVETIRMLEKLNPSRDPLENVGLMFGTENYQIGLPRFNKQISTEAISLEYIDNADPTDADEYKSGLDGIGNSAKDIANVAANLSTGIMLEVTIEQGGDKATIPVSVRLIATPTRPSVIKQLMDNASKNRTMKERWHGWRSGELAFISDIVLCQDLIDSHRETLMKDESGQYAEIVNRKNKNRLSGLLSLTPSVSTASNILIVGSDTMKEIELETGLKVSNYKHRQKFFESAYLMFIAVVDTRYEMVTIYHRGLSLPTEVSFKELKRNGKKDGIDVNEILKAYQLGDAPAF